MDPARRREAIQRRRRIILNEDNGRLLDEKSHTVEGYLSGPVGYTPPTQIDSIWLSVMAWAENLTYDTKVGEPVGLDPYPGAPKADVGHLRRLRHNIKSMLDAGTDPLKAVVDYGHAHDKEVFASFRMNMIKDSWRPNFSTRWKRERPECCLGLRGMFEYSEPDDLRHNYWSALDYAQSAVHDHRLAVFNEICRGYEVDGLELDFWRWPMLFKPSLEGLPVQARHVELMNGFMRRVRKRLKEIEDERNRVILIAPRVFDTEDICLRMGLDVRTWLKEGLIDLLVVGGDYDYYSIPVSEWAELSHQYGVPMYPCMYRSQGLERDRALAQHFYACGADGIYTFNFRFPNAVDSVNEIGDPQLIARRDKQYAMSGGGNIAHACAPPLLPVRLNPRWTRSVPLLVGDDVQTAAVDNELAELRLTVSLRGFSLQRHEIHLKVNGRRLGKCLQPQAEGDTWHLNYTLYTLYTDVRREPPIVQGSNLIEAALESRGPGSGDPVTLTGLQLKIRYQ